MPSKQIEDTYNNASPEERERMFPRTRGAAAYPPFSSTPSPAPDPRSRKVTMDQVRAQSPILEPNDRPTHAAMLRLEKAEAILKILIDTNAVDPEKRLYAVEAWQEIGTAKSQLNLFFNNIKTAAATITGRK